MKLTGQVCLRIVLGGFLALSLGCRGRDTFSPTSPSATAVDEAVPYESIGTVHSAAGTSASSPTITTISGVTNSVGLANGVISLSCGLGVVNGARAVNDQPGVYRWTIAGTGFGSRGTVTVAGQATPVVSWSDSRIVIDPTMPWNSGPISTWLVVRTAAGAVASKGVAVAPSLRTRLYGQCTHFVALRRLQTGRQPSPTAYDGHTAIGAAWIPRAGDILNFGPRQHTAFVESVGPRTVERDGTVVYPLLVSDQNGDCRGSIRTTATAFKVRAGAVVLRPLSSATKLGGAISYYR